MDTVHPAGIEAASGVLPLRRRELLVGLAALPLLLLAADTPPLPLRRTRIEPEPLRHFPGLAEGFHRAGRHVYYLDEFALTWAPLSLDAADLAPAQTLTPQVVSDLLPDLRARHWAWAVEHAALRRLDSDRPLAIALLSAAIAHNPVLRLCDLLALLLARTAPYRLDALFAAIGTPNAQLAARIAKWRTPAWLAGPPPEPVWGSPGTDGRPFTVRIASR